MAGSASTEVYETGSAAFVMLELHLPGHAGVPAGVLLLDSGADRLHVRVREQWPASLDATDREVLQAIAWDLRERVTRESGSGVLAWLEDSFSHVLRVSERRPVLLHQPEQQAEDLYRKHVDAEGREAPLGRHRATPDAPVIPFRTHLPYYPMRIAAGVFAGDMEVEADGWVPVPEGLRCDPGYFVASISGKSMEPRVPDGSVCLFRAQPQGSREGKLLLVQKHGASESGGEFTIKRYHSEKAVLGAGEAEEFDDAPEWRHSRVRLISLNPEYPSWDLEADQCQVIAEFVRVLEADEVPEEFRG